jgi:hypothetical protein
MRIVNDTDVGRDPLAAEGDWDMPISGAYVKLHGSSERHARDFPLSNSPQRATLNLRISYRPVFSA